MCGCWRRAGSLPKVARRRLSATTGSSKPTWAMAPLRGCARSLRELRHERRAVARRRPCRSRRRASGRTARHSRPVRRLRPRPSAARRGPAGPRRRNGRAARQQWGGQEDPEKKGPRPGPRKDLSGAHYRAVVKAGLIQVPEGRKVFPDLSVRENLELGSFTRAHERRAANVEKMFHLFPRLRECMAQRAGTMSGGEQQMLAIARGLMAEPVLLILDEPSLGLAPRLVQEMFALIRTLRDGGLAVLLVEQNVGQSLEIADRACVLENGSMRFSGTPEALLGSDMLRRAYLGL